MDRPLARILHVEPRMLTSRVSVKRVPFEGRPSERIRMWLWGRNSVRSGIWFALLLGIGLNLLALVIACIIKVPMLGLQGDIDGIPMMLVATAGFSGALFGFLQAVAIFAVQLRSQQDTSMLPLTPLIARRYFTFLILGGVAGVTIANLIGSFAAPILPVGRNALAVLTWINLLAVPVATLFAFWYLATIVSEAGEADMDIALPVLRATMRAQAVADARVVALLNEYGNALESTGIKYNPFAGSRQWSQNNSIRRIMFTKSGVIRDLDCKRLQRVGKLLEQLHPRPELSITVAFDQPLTTESALILTWDVGYNPDTPSEAPAISDEFTKKLGSALNQSIIVNKGVTE